MIFKSPKSTVIKTINDEVITGLGNVQLQVFRTHHLISSVDRSTKTLINTGSTQLAMLKFIQAVHP